MSALEWLDAVRADLDELDACRDGYNAASDVRTLFADERRMDKAHDRVEGAALDRLDRMERALRGVMEAHDWAMHCGNPRHTRMDATCDQCEAVCVACGERYPCPTVTTIQEALG